MVRGRFSGRSGVDPVVEISDSEYHFPPRRPGQKQKDVTCVGHLRCFELLCLAGAMLLLLVQVLLPGLYSDRFALFLTL